jgi:hypothetical protein
MSNPKLHLHSKNTSSINVDIFHLILSFCTVTYKTLMSSSVFLFPMLLNYLRFRPYFLSNASTFSYKILTQDLMCSYHKIGHHLFRECVASTFQVLQFFSLFSNLLSSLIILLVKLQIIFTGFI